MREFIDRQVAIDALIYASKVWDSGEPFDEGMKSGYESAVRILLSLPSQLPKTLTDREKRIFLAAMDREEKVCIQVDEECRNCREPYETSLVCICHEIIRKVKGALWT